MTFDSHRPVSRQYEDEYYRYYGWRILRTAVAWARYAALFKNSSNRKLFYGLQR